MFLLNDPDRSTVAQQDFFEPDLSVNPLSAAVRGVGAGMSLAPTVAQFMLGDDEPIVEELPSLLTMASRGAKGEIRSLVDTAAENATMYRARQEDAMMQSGMASNLAYGLSYYLSGFVGGGLNPASYGLGLGKARMETEIRAGVDEDTAFTIGAIEGVTAGVGAGIPFLGKTMVQRFGFGVAANVVPGIAQRKAEQVTFGEVYQERAPDVFDPVALTVDAVMGGAFGYLSGIGAKPDTIPMDAVNDALDANLNVRAADAAPGFPNPKAFGIHMRMVKETLDAQAEGRAPDYSPLLDAEFADSPEMLRNFEESLADVTAGRMTDDRPIYDDILPQIEATGVYSAPEARANAKLASMAYTAMAKRMGMNPRDLLDQVPLKVVTDAVEGFGQGNRASITFKPETNFLQAETPAGMVGGKVTDGTLRITYAEVAPESRGKGEGIKLYRALIDDALAKGLRVTSDSTVEAAAVRVYQTLEKAGYTVKRLEGGKLEDGAAYGRGAKEPAFEVTAGPLRQSTSTKSLDDVRQQWEQMGIDGFVTERPNGSIILSKIVVPKESRSQGKGATAMRQLIEYADANGRQIELSPSTDFGGAKGRLVSFYKRFGFVENKGRNKDFEISEAMYRRPQDPLQQETRGTYSPDTNTIGLTRAADSSTFVHELGHHLFEMLGKLASDPNAPTQIRADFKTLVEHGGMKVDDWYASDINTRRAAHEKIADDFENYLMTGEAPSLELRNLFGMIRDWMLGVYKTIRGDVQPEVRAVFDRMLATDEQMAMKSQVVDYLAIQRQTEAKAKSSLDDNLVAAERAIDPNVEVVIDGTRIKASELLKAEEPQEATAMQKLKECLLNV